MSTFAILLLCIQACLNVFSSCAGYGAGLNSGLSLGLGSGVGLGLGTSLGLGLAPATPCASAFNGNYGLLSPAIAINPAGLGSEVGYAGAAYGGAGEGNVAVAGELPVAGTTAVAGQVPIMGAVSFSGPVAAAGAVSISGQCSCGCGY